MTGWRAPPSLMADSPVPKVNDANRVEGEEGNRGAGGLSYDMLARKALEKAGRAGKLFSELHKKSSTRKGNILAASRLKRDSDSTGTDSLATTGTGQASQEKENIFPAAAGDQQSPTRVVTPTTPNLSSTLAERTPLTETPEATGPREEVRDDLNDSLFEAMSACSLRTPKVVGVRLPPLQDKASDFNIEAPTSAADPNMSTPSPIKTSPRSAANTSLPISTNTSKAEDISPVPTSLPTSISGISDLPLGSATKQGLSSVTSDKSPTSSPPQCATKQVLSSVSSDLSLILSPPPPSAAKQVLSSVSSDMSLIYSSLPFDKSPLPDLAPEDEDLSWLEEQRTTSPGEERGKLVTDLAQLLKRSTPTPDSPLIKEPELPTEAKTKSPEQNPSTATRKTADAVTSKLPRFSPNNPDRVEQRQSSVTSGSKRLVKSATAAQSPLCNDPSATRKVAQPSKEGKGKAGSPLYSSTVLSPRRGKVARPHQGVPFNVKPAPSPSNSAGGKMAREPVSNHSPSSPLRATTTPPVGSSSTIPRSCFTSNTGSSTTPRRHKLLPLKPLNVLDTTVDPSSTTTLDSPLKAVKFTEVHKISKKSAPVHSNSPNESSVIAKKTLPSQFNNSSSLQNSPTSHENSPSSLRNISSMNRQLGKSASSSRLPLPVSMAVKKA